jgi:hypothetical protein
MYKDSRLQTRARWCCRQVWAHDREFTSTLQGTNSSKKKKAAKVKRAMQAVKKAERRQAGSVSESFAAMQLLHDPQVWFLYAARSSCH